MARMTRRPFDDIRALIADLPGPDPAAAARLEAGLGDLAAAAGWIAVWRGRPALNRPIIALFAGAHAEQDETDAIRAQMEAAAAGGSAVSRAAAHLGAGLDVYELALDRPVGDRALGPSMSERECAATLAFGMEALAKQPDLLVLGALGQGAAEAAGAIAKALAETPAQDDPLALMARLGGRETAAIAGAILAARSQRTPVLLDGRAALAAAALLHAASPGVLDHCRLGAAPGGETTAALLNRTGLRPIIGLETGLEDGTGSAAALCVVKLACSLAP
jgi:nicotinate-nucleotide--dimethylbenzimidazole phosphoribosyltransferase